MDRKKAGSGSAKKKAEPKAAKKGMGDKAVLTALKGTLIGRIIEAMKKGEPANVHDAIEPGYVDTGKRTDAYDIACLAVRIDCIKEIRRLREQADPLALFMASRGIFNPNEKPEAREVLIKIKLLESDIESLELLHRRNITRLVGEDGMVHIFDGDKVAFKKKDEAGNGGRHPHGGILGLGTDAANFCEFLEMIGSLVPEDLGSVEDHNNLFKNLFPEGGYDLLKMINSMPAQTGGGGRLRDFHFPFPPRKIS